LLFVKLRDNNKRGKVDEDSHSSSLSSSSSSSLSSSSSSKKSKQYFFDVQSTGNYHFITLIIFIIIQLHTNDAKPHADLSKTLVYLKVFWQTENLPMNTTSQEHAGAEHTKCVGSPDKIVGLMISHLG